tara:strand:+ start:192 stop:962 length:771 start_codon:yes stop_codon:yes gene_type:complete
MAQLSKIEWTNSTWNPVTGCTRISPGCKNCYAERMAKRLFAMGQPRYKNKFKVTLQPDLIKKPLSWRKSQHVFVNSMSDLFHPDVPLEYIESVFSIMQRASWHTFQILTKRPEKLLEIYQYLAWPKNIWLGVSVESSDYKYRIDYLKEIPAAVRFLSIEPLLGPINQLSLKKIDWVILGGESGPHAREMKPDWVLPIRDKCLKSGVPFFFKQWGGTKKRKSGNNLSGKIWNEFPIAKKRKFSRKAKSNHTLKRVTH